MDKVYVLIESGGSYDDAWKRNVVVSTDRVKLELKLREEEAEITALVAWQDQRYAFIDQWNNDNPEPELGQRPTEKTWPRWSSLRQDEITQQMRDDRQAIKDENARVHAEWAAPLTEWLARKRAADEKFIADAGRTERDTRYEAIDVAYRIEEIPFI